MPRTVRAALASSLLASALSLVAVATSAPPAGAATQTSSAGLSTNVDFAALVLRDGGWPVTNSNLIVLTQWMRAENPPSDWWNRNNPLNNGEGSGGGAGLGSYQNLSIAAYYVADQLQQKDYGYPRIATDLENSAAPSTTAAAIWASSWASSHYGSGSHWGTSPVDVVAAPAAPWATQATCIATYPANTFGPCGGHFTTTGSLWRGGSPQGLRGQELWTFADGPVAHDTATWSPKLASGTYVVEAYLPGNFDSANVTYSVHDAKGTHLVHVDQESYDNAWVSLGGFTATSAISVSVTLSDASTDRAGSTYVAADAMRFVATTCAYPANTYGPVCGQGFTTTGTSWHSGSPEGLVGKELWTTSHGATAANSATWAPSLSAGTYDVSAFVPSQHATAHVTYVVTDATGVHAVPVAQASAAGSWILLGDFTATTATGIKVTLGDASTDPVGSTDVGVDAVSFVLDSQPLTVPDPPSDVSAAAGDASATVTWLAPAKNGGSALTKETVTASPGGRSCSVIVTSTSANTCTVAGLANGTGYTFTVRAFSAEGASVASAPSLPVLPQLDTIVALASSLATSSYGQPVVLTATMTPAASTGTVLFSDDFNLVPGCGAVALKAGRATCRTTSLAVGTQSMTAMYSGDTIRAGSGSLAVGVSVHKAPTHIVAAATPVSAPVGQTITLQATGLPGSATGTTVFAWGSQQLCAAPVRLGAATCRTSTSLKAATYRIVAKYGGSPDLIGSSSVTTFVIT